MSSYHIRDKESVVVVTQFKGELLSTDIQSYDSLKRAIETTYKIDASTIKSIEPTSTIIEKETEKPIRVAFVAEHGEKQQLTFSVDLKPIHIADIYRQLMDAQQVLRNMRGLIEYCGAYLDGAAGKIKDEKNTETPDAGKTEKTE